MKENQRPDVGERRAPPVGRRWRGSGQM